jgi:hypothetical protein
MSSWRQLCFVRNATIFSVSYFLSLENPSDSRLADVENYFLVQNELDYLT